jgi:hypothetical protein
MFLNELNKTWSNLINAVNKVTSKKSTKDE